MRDFRLRRDLKRSVIDGFELPLGIEPLKLKPPTQGYTIAFNPGEQDEPDTYTFQVVVSHGRLVPIIEKAFEMLPDEIVPIVEIGSRDAYRSLDVYLGREAIPLSEFLDVWVAFKDILVEDAAIGIGANSEEPFVEVFLDSWKTLTIHVLTEMRDEVEAMLQSFDLEEVPETWSSGEDESDLDPRSQIREVLEIVDEHSPDIDELLLQLRQVWDLELNIDPETNVDESGRRLGLTLWHAYVLLEAADGDETRGAYLSLWATASSFAEVEGMIHAALAEYPEWSFGEIYTLDRISYDDRPNDLADLPPRRLKSQVHMVQIDEWGEGNPPGGPDRPGDRPGDRSGDRSPGTSPGGRPPVRPESPEHE
jgi:hypothetical protein